MKKGFKKLAELFEKWRVIVEWVLSRWSGENKCLEKALRCLGFIRCTGYDNNPVTCSGKRFMDDDVSPWYLTTETQLS